MLKNTFLSRLLTVFAFSMGMVPALQAMEAPDERHRNGDYSDEGYVEVQQIRNIKTSTWRGPTMQEKIKKVAFKCVNLAVAAAQVYAGIYLLSSKKSEGSYASGFVNDCNTGAGLAVICAGIWRGLGSFPLY